MSGKHQVLFLHRQLEPLRSMLIGDFDVLCAWVPEEFEQAHQVRAVVVAGEVPLDEALIAGMPQLQLIACASTGYDGIDPAWVQAQGILLTHAREVNDGDVADHALACIMAHLRGLSAGDRLVRAGDWASASTIPNRSLSSLKVGIVGLGAIGKQLGRKAVALGMGVRWWGPNAKDAPWPRAQSLIELARNVDALVVTARAHPGNVGLISSDVLEALRPGGQLVNVARGQLVDEAALIAALRSGRLGGAALDVFHSEPTAAARWADVPALLTPHIAGRTKEALSRVSQQLKGNLVAFFSGEPLLTPLLPLET
ncbi:NAD(P)-dependent oxidoreductase [Sphingomonas xinjiangensis]|uniref:Lactate dehydrogenase-like 2-hydroxyacid dehydrogenase n=1 Tax=Sphingomonas xinjiangensis TaxID=643568 RepID=A0A840YP02_9SPHN|nr:NAD(P)-dependent oxidoreductase [Sphingomonas xinjiangensis]MBB5711840.1 lactate dehydrogenase-like 2-hydroxyacid dehydrogenase [Sphingomonas xinjiangensis]